MKTYNKRLEIALKLQNSLKKYIYLTEKIQNEIIHADTLMLFRQTEKEVEEHITELKTELSTH
jgi:hypothetical protein